FIFLVEQASPTRRGLLGAIGPSAAETGMLLGSGAGAALAGLLSAGVLHEWAWRIPFLLGPVVALAGVWLRRGIEDVPHAALGAPAPSPLAETLRCHWRLLVKLAGLSMFNAVGFYLVFLY